MKIDASVNNLPESNNQSFNQIKEINKQPEIKNHEEQLNLKDKNGEKREVTIEDLEEMVKASNELMDAIDRGLKFSVHEGTNRTLVQVIDRNTDDVIKEIPPEKMLDLVARIWEVVGIFVDEKV
ncbi:flagellar protein FlaG [Desulfitispora alkaliphila]|uniref:flagellar protein FlaG n=1 Tax=Desulfitispora alkaliphila TaxID=622674 RepID=UPI003D1C29AA